MNEKQKKFYDFMVETRKEQVVFVLDKFTNYISKPVEKKVMGQFKTTLKDVLNEKPHNEVLEDYLKNDFLIKFGVKSKKGGEDKIKKFVEFRFLADLFLINDMWTYFKDKEIKKQEYINYVKNRCPSKERFVEIVTSASNGIKKIIESKDFDIDTVKARNYILQSMPGLVGRGFKVIKNVETLLFGNSVDKIREIFTSKIIKEISKELLSFYTLKIIDLYKLCAEHEANLIYNDN